MKRHESLPVLVPSDPDLSALPVTFPIGATPLFGVALLIAGIAGPVVVGGLLGLIGLFAQGLPDSWGWIVLGFAAIPLLALPWGWWVLRTRTTVQIASDEVAYRRKTPLGTTHWQAPLSEYVAVAYRKVLPPSRSLAGVTRHAVELWNGSDRKHDVRLVQSTDETLARETLTRLATLTSLPTEEGEPVRG